MTTATLLSAPHYSLAEFRKMVGGISPETGWRWAHKGVGPNRIKLKTTRIGGRVRILQADLDAFLTALNPVETKSEEPERKPAATRRASSAAARELEAMGV